MKSVIAEFEQGSEWDSVMLFFGLLLIICGFLSTYDMEFWQASDRLLIPLVIAGVSLVLLNLFLRFVRPKLKVTLFEIQDDLLKICPIRNFQFSGWTARNPVTIEISEIVSIKAHDFYSIGTKAGMYWVCVELKNNQVIEFHFESARLLNEVIDFVKIRLPGVELELGRGWDKTAGALTLERTIIQIHMLSYDY